MESDLKSRFQEEILKNVVVHTKNVIVKPNWVSNVEGCFTSAKVLDWLFECLPAANKYVIESYTPWRGLVDFVETDDLEKAKGFYLFYRDMDKVFFANNGFFNVLKKYEVNYVNVTEAVWNGDCVDKGLVREFLGKRSKRVCNDEFLGYVPEEIFAIKHDSLFVDLARLKLERSNPNILISGCVKNLFGMIPVPKRKVFHGKNDSGIFSNARDMFTLYDTLFWNKMFIVEGIGGMVEDYCNDSQRLINCGDRFYVGRCGIGVDRKVCSDFGINPSDVGYLR